MPGARRWRRRSSVGAAAAIAIGATVALDALFGGPLYVAGPVAGATLGAGAHQLIRTPDAR